MSCVLHFSHSQAISPSAPTHTPTCQRLPHQAGPRHRLLPDLGPGGPQEPPPFRCLLRVALGTEQKTGHPCPAAGLHYWLGTGERSRWCTRIAEPAGQKLSLPPCAKVDCGSGLSFSSVPKRLGRSWTGSFFLFRTWIQWRCTRIQVTAALCSLSAKTQRSSSAM